MSLISPLILVAALAAHPASVAQVAALAAHPAPVAATAALEVSPPPSGTATIPLDELFQRLGPKASTGPLAPSAVVVRADLKGRLGLSALFVTARFEVEALDAERWSQLTLLPVGGDIFVTSFPAQLNEATVAVVGDKLVFLAQARGRWAFEVGLTVRASVGGSQRRASLRAGEGPRTPLALEIDPAFSLIEPRARGGGVEVFPRGGVWNVAWTATEAAAVAEAPVERPPIEPRVTRATAVWLTTLEGSMTVRLSYALALDAPQGFQISLPSGQRLERVTVNGRPLTARPEGGKLDLKVMPRGVGEPEATVELVLAQELGVFHLSGRLSLELPRVSWPIALVEARAHFPAVFDWRREGGSLEESGADATPTPPDESELPGKTLRFRQHLVSRSAPTLELGYSVDISKSYFRGRGDEG